MSDTMITIGRKLREARIKKHMTQIEVAHSADIGPNTYAILERGAAKNITLVKLEKIIKVLGVKSSDILPF